MLLHVLSYLCEDNKNNLYFEHVKLLHHQMKLLHHQMKRYLHITLATIFTGLGLLGAFLHLLPTTPFLLLAIFLYMLSSKSGVKMILGNRYLAPYVKSYFSKKGMPTAILIRTLLLLWLTMGCCILWVTGNIFVRILLAVIAIGVTVHLYNKREK